MSASVLMIFSHRVRESKTVFISGLHAVDSGFQSLVGSISQILEFGFLTSQTCLHTLMQTRLSAYHSVGTIFRNTSWNHVAKALYLDKALAWENCYWLDEASFWQIRSTTQISWTYVSMAIWKQGFLLYTITPCSYNRPFAWWRHFNTTTRILQGFAFLCKLGLLLFKPRWDYKI